MLKYIQIYRTILRNFGFTLRPVGTFTAYQVRNGLHALTRGLDHLLYPGFRKVPIDRPVFILGNPRSGTTFLHRFLLNSGDLAAFELWEMLFPAVSARKLLGG
ncbi:MAG: sulfotransferase, partial [Deltaproteobacteria bacterium]|nr:sulfotransferase [Deltaproteobacteria bacterium]